MIDYGAIAFKNGKLMTTEFFGDMKEMVGWEDTETDMYYDYYKDKYVQLKLAHNYFAYIGDEDNTIAFYKTHFRIVENMGGKFYNHCEYPGNTHYTWSKWKMWLGDGEVTVTKRNGYFVCKWKYKGDKYKVYFGYGVDINWYTKWHVINAYRTPAHLFRKFIRNIKDKIYDWRNGI